MDKSVIFSAIQPTGILTIGNYIGALQSWNKVQDDYNCIYSVADLHAITVRQNFNTLRKRSLDCVALCLACGVDPSKSTIFIQSHVSEHSQLAWILNCFAYFGELSRMTQFKHKLLNRENNINIGLFDYPTLMAADVLLYKTDFVLVGDDQKQHLEFIRRLSRRFNSIYGEVFMVPKKFFVKFNNKVMSLLDPKKKMSKSDINYNNIITLLDSANSIVEKIKYAITDSDNPPVIRYDPVNKPGISNLLNVLSAISEKSISCLEKMFAGKMYNDLKKEVTDVILDRILSIQSRYYLVRNNEDYLYKIIFNGAKKAQRKAYVMLNKIKELIGFIVHNQV
ncbi:MAG: tryptophan--tRNA ligase [Candidatus Westeberhardia cardiocondylae]|nr:tryptophan--tRNA ligase [Candidatus Westeberhardia cardiocondylae]